MKFQLIILGLTPYSTGPNDHIKHNIYPVEPHGQARDTTWFRRFA